MSKLQLPSHSAHQQTLVTSPEVELLLCCARSHITPAIGDRIKTLLQQDIDWVSLKQIAAGHAVIPLLYQSLNINYIQAVPKTIQLQIRSYLQKNAVHNLLLTQELLKLLNLFKEHNIRAIPFKGPVLAVSAYGNLTLRQFGDLDILVSEQDFLKAIDLLIKRGGYQLGRWFLNDTQEIARLKYSNEHSLIRNDEMVLVDIHQNITARHFFCFPLDFDKLWQRLELVTLIDSKVPNLPLEDLLMMLCVHGSKHLWERLSWICDLAFLVETHQKMDWEGILIKARKLGIERMLLLGLFLANNLLGATLPEQVDCRIQADLETQKLAAQVRQYLFSETDSLSQGLNFINFSFHFRMMERLQDKVHLCAGTFFRFVILTIGNKMTPSLADQQFLPLPRPFYFLYYLIRPIRVAFKFTVITWQHRAKAS